MERPQAPRRASEDKTNKPYFPPDNVPAVWKVGDVLPGDYTVTAILGQGGMGTVYKVVNPIWKELAVKSPRPDIFARAGSQENFIREAETWVRLAPHPHIVLCYFVVVMGGIPRIFTEYVDGGSLASWIRQRTLYEGGPQGALACILDVAIQFAWGLHAAHEQGLVHQDVKPANVMLTRQGMIKVTDFGLAKARALSGEGQAMAAAGKQSVLVSVAGRTPAYCSPEQLAGQALGRRTDIWSWAVSVLEMFVGGVTWKLGTEAREVLAWHKQRDALIPPMPGEVAKLLDLCLQWQPEARPANMLEVATELRAIYARLLGSAYTRKTPQLAAPDAALLRNKGLSLARLGRYEEALVACEKAIQIAGPIDAHTYFAKGVSLLGLGRYEEALGACEKAIRLDPNHAHAYHNKGVSLQELGRYEEALLAYEQAIRLDPNVVQAYFNKSGVLEKLGRYEEALLAYEQAIRLSPNNAQIYFNKGLLLAMLGRYEEALLALEQAIRLDPNDANVHTTKGEVLQELGRYEEALGAYEQAIRLGPNVVQAYFNKGRVLEKLRRYEEALLAYEQAIRFDPNVVQAYNNKGVVLSMLERYEEALVALEQAIRLDPNYALAYNNKGVVLQELGRNKEALLAYEQSTRLDPTNTQFCENKNDLLRELDERGR